MPDQLPPYVDFTHPDYTPTPTPKGVQYPIGMTPQKAASLLVKAVRKPKLGQKQKGKGKGKGKVHAKPTTAKPATTPRK